MALQKNTNLIQTIIKIKIQKSTNVDYIEAYHDDHHITIAFDPGFDWEEIYHSPGSAEFTETQKGMTAGLMYDQKLKVRFPGENETNLQQFSELEGIGLVIRIDFSDGKSKVFGTIANPAYLVPDYKAGDGGPGLQIVFECQSPKRAPWLHSS